ncbi:hypothetical protein [Dyadobacter endophyticus]|nr:hypothetical protein [Dyadobacter endophyticus]
MLKIAEILVGVWIMLTILLIASDLLSLPDTDFRGDPFYAYRHNPVIINISIASLVFRLAFVGLLIYSNIKPHHQKGKTPWYAFFISGFAAAFLQWYELYYGSTFYYGEVRDKQGLMFPLLASFIATLMIWKFPAPINEQRNLIWKLILTALVNIGLYILWLNVYEPWNLFQS